MRRSLGPGVLSVLSLDCSCSSPIPAISNWIYQCLWRSSWWQGLFYKQREHLHYLWFHDQLVTDDYDKVEKYLDHFVVTSCHQKLWVTVHGCHLNRHKVYHNYHYFSPLPDFIKTLPPAHQKIYLAFVTIHLLLQHEMTLSKMVEPGNLIWELFCKKRNVSRESLNTSPPTSPSLCPMNNESPWSKMGGRQKIFL